MGRDGEDLSVDNARKIRYGDLKGRGFSVGP